MMAFETLFTPLQMGSLSIPNRVIMAPLTRARTPDSVPGEMQEAYYGQRAGAGLIISEATNISPPPAAMSIPQAFGRMPRKLAGKVSLKPSMLKVAVLPCSCGTLGVFPMKWFNLTANSR
ncbi:hypothetical protein HORIV_63210 [Vreelandella olivaria]|uniref:NADH:flavin oxidoreductase/NADH oxidase N-terminal domain-containing protein n=1 Tax=Vreelandella olivaria TaxID=390919 RepID=A0ABM7GQB0_9GAMM|nr:hypothetical protein HORIV_63210 [Halomonas olivaria]